MEEEFKISKDLLKTVTVDTRVDILKALENRPMTASELSRFLDKHVTTVSEHLDLLKFSNLVERVERPGRKWIYYNLTKEGKKLLHPTSYKWVVVLSLVFFVLVSSWFAWNVDAYPGDLLYGIKRARESLQLSLTQNSLDKTNLHLDFAEERLKELKVIASRGEGNAVKQIMIEYNDEMDDAKVELENAKKENMNIVPVLETMSEITSKHTSILGNLAARSPEFGGEIQPALEKSIEEHDAALTELQNITGIPYAVGIPTRSE